MKEIIKKLLKSSSIGKMIYPFIHKCYRIVAIPIKRRRLQRNGAMALRKMHEALTDVGIDYYADWGTLLGIVRDGGFIRHDDDMDLTIVDKNVDARALLTMLLGKGFKFIHLFKTADRILEFTMAWNKLSIDLFFRIPVDCPGKVGVAGVYFDPKIKYDTPDQNSYRLWYFKENIKTKQIQFQGTVVRVPEDTEEMLEFEYGDDWRSPISGWSADRLKGRYEYKKDFVVRVTNLKDVI